MKQRMIRFWKKTGIFKRYYLQHQLRMMTSSVTGEPGTLPFEA
ncbi:MAG: hypothetical protein AAFR61_04955 [Bacteroidota bacterium]